MDKLMIVAIVFGSITLWVAIIPVTVLLIVRMVKGGGAKRQHLADQETRMIQEIHQGLSKMEARVETLETLLLERERKDDQA